MTTVTKEMIGAAHDVMLAKGDFVLSAAMLERIYLAMEQAAPPPQTPFDTCPTCEAHAAVAELIEAADELKDVCNRPSAARTRAESWRRLDRALARVRSS